MTELVLVFVALMVLVFVAAATVRQRPKSEFEQAVEHMTAAFDEFRVALGEQLTPAVSQATAAIKGLLAAALEEESSDG